MIHHLSEPTRWDALTDNQRAYVADSIQSEGFIHLSTREQVAATFGRYYADRRDLVLLDVDESHPEVAAALKWEPAPSGELFPHLYGSIPAGAIIRAQRHWQPTPSPVQRRYQFTDGYDDGSATFDPNRFGWPDVEAQLVDARNYWITSVRPDGRPHAAPVWGIWLGNVLAFSSGPTSVKGRNLAANPNCVAHLDSGDTVVILEGTVSELTGHRLDAFIANYPPKYAITPDPADPGHGMFLLTPTTARTWLESAFLESASLWTFA
jgi:uncharacterized protein (DUF952 family)